MALPQRNRTTYLQNGESHVDDFQGNLIPRKRAVRAGSWMLLVAFLALDATLVLTGSALSGTVLSLMRPS